MSDRYALAVEVYDRGLIRQEAFADALEIPRKLYGVTELAAAFNVRINTIQRWRTRGKLPEPQQLACGPIWSGSEIEEMIAAGGPTPRPSGRPSHLRQTWQTDAATLRLAMLFGYTILGMSTLKLAGFFDCHHSTILEHLYGRRGR